MNARLSPLAWGDVADAADWYEQQSPGLGRQFEVAIDQLVATLAVQPQLYGRVARAPARREIREGPVPGFPFVASYEVMPTEVVILAVTHGSAARRPWRSRLP